MKEKLDEKEKNYLKGISKALYILAAIGKVCLTIAIPFIVLAMVIILVVFNRFDYHDNTLYFDNEKIVTLEESIDGIILNYAENTSELLKYNTEDQVILLKVKNFLDNNSKGIILAYVEILLGTSLVLVIILRMIYEKVRLLFKNIHEGATPFTEENTLYLKYIIKFMIIQMIVSIVMSLILQFLIDVDTDYFFNVNGIYELLIVIVTYYIFKYGTLLQSKSKLSIYD